MGGIGIDVSLIPALPISVTIPLFPDPSPTDTDEPPTTTPDEPPTTPDPPPLPSHTSPSHTPTFSPPSEPPHSPLPPNDEPLPGSTHVASSPRTQRPTETGESSMSGSSRMVTSRTSGSTRSSDSSAARASSSSSSFASTSSTETTIPQTDLDTTSTPPTASIPLEIPSSTPLATGTLSSPSSSPWHPHTSLSSGAIAGIILATLAVIAVIAVWIFFARRRSRSHSTRSDSSLDGTVVGVSRRRLIDDGDSGFGEKRVSTDSHDEHAFGAHGEPMSEAAGSPNLVFGAGASAGAAANVVRTKSGRLPSSLLRPASPTTPEPTLPPTTPPPLVNAIPTSSFQLQPPRRRPTLTAVNPSPSVERTAFLDPPHDYNPFVDRAEGIVDVGEEVPVRWRGDALGMHAGLRESVDSELMDHRDYSRPIVGTRGG